MPQSGFFMSVDKANAISSVSPKHSDKQCYCITKMSFKNISEVNPSCHVGRGGWQRSCQTYEGYEREFNRQNLGQKMSEVRCLPVS